MIKGADSGVGLRDQVCCPAIKAIRLALHAEGPWARSSELGPHHSSESSVQACTPGLQDAAWGTFRKILIIFLL